MDEVFEISRIIKVEVWVIGRDIDDNSYRDLDYSRYHKNRIWWLFYYTSNEFFLSRFHIKCFQSLWQLFLFLRFSQFFLFHVISKQLLCNLRRPFVFGESLSSTIFSMSVRKEIVSWMYNNHCKIKETLLMQELKPSFNVNFSSEKLMLL